MLIPRTDYRQQQRIWVAGHGWAKCRCGSEHYADTEQPAIVTCSVFKRRYRYFNPNEKDR